MSTLYDPLVDLRVSPTGPVVIGRVSISAVQLSDQGDLFYLLDINAGLAKLPRELYVRELWDLDLADLRAVGDFLEKFGPPALNIEASPKRDPAKDRQADLPVRAVVTLEAIRAGVSRLRNTIRCWDHLTGGIDVDDLEEQWDGPELPPASIDKCLDYIYDLEPALACFAPRLPRPDEDFPVVGTYSALAAQLFNRVVTGEGFKHCEEQTCGRPFTRYESRVARAGSKPAKARFCSQRCSDRHFNREFRRREQVQRLKSQGLSTAKIAEKMNATTAEVKAWLEGVSKEG